jgi:hypothetical protein
LFEETKTATKGEAFLGPDKNAAFRFLRPFTEEQKELAREFLGSISGVTQISCYSIQGDFVEKLWRVDFSYLPDEVDEPMAECLSRLDALLSKPN